MSAARTWNIKMLSILLSAAFVLCIVAAIPAQAQITTKVASVVASSAGPRMPLTLKVDLQQGETIERVFLVYRPFGSSDYNRIEMDIVGNTASAAIPAEDVVPPFVEYYLVLVGRDGKLESYPLSETADPFETPPGKTLQITVSGESNADKQVMFLSPEPDSRVSAEDLLISISLLRADSIVVKRATQLLLDGGDISSSAVVTGDIIVVAPENTGMTIRPGAHRLTVRLFDREGNLHRTSSIMFTVTGRSGEPVEPSEEWKYYSSIQLESRHEDISSEGTWYNRANLTFTGTTGDWRFNASTFVTSDEKANRQPQDRFFASAELPWVRIGYGDAYPSFPNLILSGKRVRGLTSALRLGWFNLDLTLGRTTRAIDGALLQVVAKDSLVSEQLRDPNAAYAPIDSLTWGKFRYGTYAQNLFAIRPSFGSGNDWQLGFTWLKAKDDVGSITYGIRPQENFVLGSDLIARFDERRIELSGQGAFSAYNSDISSGTFTDAYIDTVYPDDASRIKRLRDILENIITVNDNLRPLSFKKFSTVAYELGLGLNYFDNALKLTYLFRGSDYNSFGQTFLRKDIRGLNITDRIRFAENRVLTTASLELLKDNTGGTKVATTSFTNLNLAVSYYPDPQYPNFTVGFARYGSDNGISPSDSINRNYIIDDATNRFFVQSSYDFVLSGHHTASFSLSTSNRNDNSLQHYNVKNLTIALGLVTKYAVPLQTSINITINTNTLPSTSMPGTGQNFNYTTLSLNARYAIVQDILTATVTANPTFGDFQRTAWDAGVSWNALQMMTFDLQFSLYNNQGISQDTIWDLRYRYDI